jgi:hypothetical protein
VQPPPGGIVGSFHDPGSGVLVSGTRGAAQVQAIFEVGTSAAPPYARELVTLAPIATRSGNTLTVVAHYQRTRADAKIPGSLGAFWQIDLQDQESLLLRDTLLDVAGIPLRPTAADAAQATFTIPSSVRAPYHLTYRLEFFNRSEVFRFTIGEDGRASFDGPGAVAGPTAGGTGVANAAPEAPDPKLPKRDRPPDPFTETAPGPGPDTLTPRSPAAVLSAPANWDAKPGTWLTPTSIKDRPQDLRGVWVDADAQTAPPQLEWFDDTPPRLRVMSLALRGRAWSVDVTPAGVRTWKGRVYVCPLPEGTCPNLCRWTRGELSVDGDTLHATGQWYGTKSKPDCSGYSDEPDTGPIAFRRFIGVSFVPLLPGKYLQLVAAPAVGSQPAQFKAAVRLATHYAGIPDVTVRVASSGSGSVSALDRSAGTYEFTATRSGVYEITFELVAGDGVVVHTDRVRVEIPAIPGIGL